MSRADEALTPSQIDRMSGAEKPLTQSERDELNWLRAFRVACDAVVPQMDKQLETMRAAIRVAIKGLTRKGLLRAATVNEVAALRAALAADAGKGKQ